MERFVAALALSLPLAFAPTAFAQDKGAGKAVYEKTCALCHGPGLAGAPKYGSKSDWAPRLKAGAAKLHASALKGTANGMPAKGGNLALFDGEVKAAVDYLMAAAGGAKAEAAAAPAKVAAKTDAKSEGKSPAPKAEATPKPAAADAGKATYEKTCALCHGPGIAGAPKFANKGDWAARVKGGAANLHASALKGTANGMPAKGGNPALPDADVKAAVDYMLAAVGEGKSQAPAAAATAVSTPSKAAPVPASPGAPPPVAGAPAPPAPLSAGTLYTQRVPLMMERARTSYRAPLRLG